MVYSPALIHEPWLPGQQSSQFMKKIYHCFKITMHLYLILMGRKRGGDIDQSQYKNPVFKGQEIHNPWMVPSPPLAYYNFSQIKNVNTCIKSKGSNFHKCTFRYIWLQVPSFISMMTLSLFSFMFLNSWITSK